MRAQRPMEFARVPSQITTVAIDDIREPGGAVIVRICVCAALLQWQRSYERAALMQASLAMVGSRSMRASVTSLCEVLPSPNTSESDRRTGS